MHTFRQGDLVKVPFPYTDRATRQRRPAIVVSTGDLQKQHSLIWVAMITSAENRAWAGDVAIGNDPKTGLITPSVVRPAKIATIDARDAEQIGRVTASVVTKVIAQVARQIGSMPDQ